MSGVPGPVPSPACCPVCQARFRGSAACSRCGADLIPLMLLAAHAYRLRQRARRSLAQGDIGSALESIRSAQRLHATTEGGLVEFICIAVVGAPSGQA